MGTRQRVEPSWSGLQHACGCLQQKRDFGRVGEIGGELWEQAVGALIQRRHHRKLLRGSMTSSIPGSGIGQAGVLRVAHARKLFKGFSSKAAPWVSKSG